ncbi:MAG TPA: tagaturonate epimerase family protein [Ktedonobacterales bacterium]|nr:tagaturonate epimerase family protein [Ktedonobacterales bacterium]
MTTRNDETALDRDMILRDIASANIVHSSFTMYESAAYWLEMTGDDKTFCVVARAGDTVLAHFRGESGATSDTLTMMRCPADSVNGRTLRAALPWLTPQPLGLQTSAGCGDRLGLATPGHVLAFQRVQREVPDSHIAAIFAQQSIREMTRTRRTPDEVLTDATWGAFQQGWRDQVGADADHLKTTEDIDACADAGYSFYTIDPGDYVDAEADSASADQLQRKIADLPWDVLESSPDDLIARYDGHTITLAHESLTLDRLAIMRAAAKYSGAIAHVARMYRHLAAKHIPSELEVSVDETETPTTPSEHVFIASELRRLGVQWVSLAPRYIGEFEKGIDYIGDLDALTTSIATHAAIAQAFGPYKLSLHSGSDKFSVYGIFAEATNGMVHLKTAGTSYVEALRVVAQSNPTLFREILALARVNYDADRASYHVSAETTRAPDAAQFTNDVLANLLDEPNTRQIVHVTFGSTLATFGSSIKATLHDHAATYATVLEQHFYRHLLPFAQSAN